MYVGSQFSGRSKATGIRTKITGLRSKTTELRTESIECSFGGILDLIPCILLGIYMEKDQSFTKTTYSPILYRKPLNAPLMTGIRTQISVIRSKIPQVFHIFANFAAKTPENIQKTLYIGSQFTVVRSKTTRIRSKIPQNDNDFFDFIPDNLNHDRKSRSRLRNCAKTRQKNYYTNVAIFSTLDRNFEILEFFNRSKIRSWNDDTSW